MKENISHQIIQVFQKRRFIFIFIFIFFLGLLAIESQAFIKADTVYTTDGSYSDVNNAVADSNTGDTVLIPPGIFTWSRQLSITKAITLKGAGIDKSIINHGYSDALIYINPSSDLAIRITGLYIKQTTNNVGYKSIYINGSINGGYCLTKIRIDHNKIEKGTRAIAIRGWVEGVIDSNEFLNCNIAVGPVGDNNYSWSRSIEAGTSHSLFIEDNIFTVDNNTDRQPNEQIYHQEGARTVTRYNTYDASGYTNFTSCTAPFFDSHGNQNYYTGSSDFRGQPILEVYNNTIHVYKAIGCDLSHIRGGSALIYNNTYIYETGSAPNTIRATEEDGWQTLMFAPLRTKWAGEDQVTNTFIWNNTLQLGINGTPNEIKDIILCNPTTDPSFIQKDRDYFMHAPAATGGKSTYPTRQGAADMAFSFEGANAYFPYTPYTYPHPLRNYTASYTDNTQEPAPTTSVPPTIAVSPTIKDFGTLPINTSSPAQRFTVTTTGGNLNVDAISMTGTDATQFAIQNDSCTGKIIAPETGSCTFDVKFSPLSVGAKAANVAIIDNDSNTSKLIAVNGTGTSQIPAISFSPTSLSFSNVLSGTLSTPQTIRVSNTSTNFVTISSISLSGTYANQFSIPAATDYCTGETVAASGNCSFQVIFAPTSGGEKTANVNLTALYYSSPATLPLYGSAVVYQSPVPRIKISKTK